MTKQKNHPAPVKDSPSKGWEHYQLYKDVREAIASLPIYFRGSTGNGMEKDSPRRTRRARRKEDLIASSTEDFLFSDL
jgi:hypothetical protein